MKRILIKSLHFSFISFIIFWTFDLNLIVAHNDKTIHTEFFHEVKLTDFTNSDYRRATLRDYLHSKGDKTVRLLKAPTSLPLMGKKIVIDPGHGGYETGAYQNNIEEKNLNLDVSLKLSSLLANEGAYPILTRNDDITANESLSLPERASISAKEKADIFVSIHFNSHSNPHVTGTETYYNVKSFKGSQNPYPIESRKLAESIQTELVESIKTKDIGVKENVFHVLRNNSVPSVLLEIAFISNPKEAERTKEENFRMKAAKGIMEGITTYYKKNQPQ